MVITLRHQSGRWSSACTAHQDSAPLMGSKDGLENQGSAVSLGRQRFCVGM